MARKSDPHLVVHEVDRRRGRVRGTVWDEGAPVLDLNNIPITDRPRAGEEAWVVCGMSGDARVSHLRRVGENEGTSRSFFGYGGDQNYCEGYERAFGITEDEPEPPDAEAMIRAAMGGWRPPESS